MAETKYRTSVFESESAINPQPWRTRKCMVQYMYTIGSLGPYYIIKPFVPDMRIPFDELMSLS